MTASVKRRSRAIGLRGFSFGRGTQCGRRLPVLKLLLTALGCVVPAGGQNAVPPSNNLLPGLVLPDAHPRGDERHPITVADLMGLRHIGGLSISPDGNWVAFTLRQADTKANVYRTGLFVADISHPGALRNLGSVGPVEFSDQYSVLTINPEWSNDSREILYVMPEIAHDNEFGVRQVFEWSREGGPPKQKTHSSVDALYAIWSADGQILYSTRGPRPGFEALADKYFNHGIWYFDLDTQADSWGSISPSFTRRGTDVLDQALHHMRPLYEPASGQWLDDTDYQVRSIDSRSGTDRLATADEVATYKKLVHARNIVSGAGTGVNDPKRVWVAGPNGSELSFEMRRHEGDDTSAPSTLKGHALVFGIHKNSSNVVQVSPSAEYSYSNCSYVLQVERFACVRQNPNVPPNVVTFQADGTDERVLTNLNPETESWELPRVELVEWIDSLGNPGFGYLYKPAGFRPGVRYPTMILPYYGASYDFETSVVVAHRYPTYVFTGRGYVVLRPDMRFYMVNNDAGPSKKLRMNEGALSSILAGLRKLIDMDITDSSRVGIAGLSQGAKYTSYAIAHSKSFHAASVPVAHPSPMNSAGAYYASPQGLRDNINHDDDGRLIEGVERARNEESQVSLWADSVSAALLVDASDGDWVWSVQAAIALRERGKPVEMVVFPDARHHKRWPQQIANDSELNLDWFDFWLNDHEDPNPAKADQYSRWHKLRKLQSEFETLSH